MTAPLTTTDGRTLRVLGEIGRGGFGVVWLAELIGVGGLRREVAIKVLYRGTDEEDIERRLRDEARMLGLIRHPGVVKVDSLLKFDGRWAVMMEYIDGADLAQILEQGAIPPRAALEITSEIARVLAAAWETPNPEGRPLHLIHRDLKPSNVKITTAGEVKVLDFGVARAEFDSREAKTTRGSFGTVGYMAPERLEWVDGPEGDVYAMGAVLYELLCAGRYGRTSTLPDRHKLHVDLAFARLRPHLPDPDPGVAALLRSMLAYEASERPTPREVEDRCDALAEALGGVRLKRWAAQSLPEVSKAVAETNPSPPVMVETTGETFHTLPPEEGRKIVPNLKGAPVAQPTEGANPPVVALAGRAQEGRAQEGRTPDGRPPLQRMSLPPAPMPPVQAPRPVQRPSAQSWSSPPRWLWMGGLAAITLAAMLSLGLAAYLILHRPPKDSHPVPSAVAP